MIFVTGAMAIGCFVLYLVRRNSRLKHDEDGF